MKSMSLLRVYYGGLVGWGLYFALCASAAPSINVALKTSFSSAPFLLELLETAGDENSTAYFPLLDRVAEGRFSAVTDKDLYEQFITVLQEDGHMTNAETISSFKLALSLRTTAPRIEAHYQYYHTAVEPSLKSDQAVSCPAWVLLNGKQYCTAALEAPEGSTINDGQLETLPFDRVLGNYSGPESILYADITSPHFGPFHKTLVNTARNGKTSYRLRHRKSLASDPDRPLQISGYGVELALKRTDYIVIDDREGSDNAPTQSVGSQITLEDEDLADLKPLSTSELLSLSVKTASFVMQSEDPFATLLKLSQDFPKFSTPMAAHNVSGDFYTEHESNRAMFLPPGMNIMWINGVQIIERQIDAFSILDILRRERKVINNVRELGLTGQEVIKLLSHENIASAKSDDEPQRFDWRDDIEGGNAMIWLNDIEKDRRYSDWPVQLNALLQRTFPGQLPALRKDIHNLILPTDLSNPDDVQLVVDQIAGFVTRKIPMRFGLIPLTDTPAAKSQALIFHHLSDSYGLAGALKYLDATLRSKKTASPQPAIFDSVVTDLKLRTNKTAMAFTEVIENEKYLSNIWSAQKWVVRLAADSKVPPVFVNGVAIPRDDNWLQAMSSRVGADLQTVQRAIFEETFTEDLWIPGHFLKDAAVRRNTLIIPENEKDLKIIDIKDFHTKNSKVYDSMPKVEAQMDDPAALAHLMVFADFDTSEGQDLLEASLSLRELEPALEVVIVHNPRPTASLSRFSDRLYAIFEKNSLSPFSSTSELALLFQPDVDHVIDDTDNKAKKFWSTAVPIIDYMGLKPGQQAIFLNGRLVGPIPSSTELDLDDFVHLLAFERAKRIMPVYLAIEMLDIKSMLDSALKAAKITSLVALSTVSDIPEGIFEQASTLRVNSFELWSSKHTAIEVGSAQDSNIHVIAVVDPANEQSQRWIPILKALSELDGIYLKLYLNPKENLQELPVKRFYRYLLNSEPSFDTDGALESPRASFSGVPQEALLTLGMDVPPSWLVAPKNTIYDLDNIKLGAIKTDIDAMYELEHILIEGHSREAQTASPPRGAQLILSTERNSHVSDTLIMANLGYFQFKANPGFYKISLQEGRSSEIFQIDSVGAAGFSPVPGDESTDVSLLSFQGVTLYPRVSRKLGQETEDVLQVNNSTLDFVSRGLKFAENFLHGSVSGKAGKSEHADINIFSVASGHLYERMLNIMMVSVMKHTKHTVKFWFIEQFLSPSFKEFIPHLAAEYGFEYEMVTYKWPHWLRSQTEKQREIWGYKILFLDVLFPLSLDKVIFVDADQIVRTDMMNLVDHDLKGAPYGFTPMCDSRTEMEGFRFWKQGYWKNFLRGLPYHISALYVVDLKRFRQIAAGDRLRQQYHQLSADPNSLSNLDQDLPNHMQTVLPIHSLPQEWLWCETWCSDESLAEAKTIDLCNNPQTKEPKLDRARRQVPEWTVYDDEISAVDRRRRGKVAQKEDVMEGDKSMSMNDEGLSDEHKRDEL